MPIQKQKLGVEVITIPSFGECTLLPLDSLPDNLRTYERICITAKGFDLTELPKLAHTEIQEIFKVVAQKILSMKLGAKVVISIWISGTHLSYPGITSDEAQSLETCISSLELFMVAEGEPIDMVIDEVPVTETRENIDEDIVYCLFLGS